MKSKKKLGTSTGNEVTDKLYNNFEKHKEVFFTIRLMSPQSELTAQNSEINVCLLFICILLSFSEFLKSPSPIVLSDHSFFHKLFLLRFNCKKIICKKRIDYFFEVCYRDCLCYIIRLLSIFYEGKGDVQKVPNEEALFGQLVLALASFESVCRRRLKTRTIFASCCLLISV